MLDAAMESSFGMGAGALSAYGRSEDDKSLQRAEAMRAGRLADANGSIETKVRGVAEEFVSVFMNQVMKSMRSTVQENPKMHGDNGEKFFQEMLDSEQAKSLSKGSGYGLTELVYQSLMRNIPETPVAQAEGAGKANDTKMMVGAV